MNYLAHAYLSFNHSNILVGNMISDYIKGKKQFDYPTEIQKGIRLHRKIDNFTDTHAATSQLKSYFWPNYRLYSGAITDIVYDHFLATDVKEFINNDALLNFASSTYKMLDNYTYIFPPVFAKFYPNMKAQNWLANYQHTWAIEKSMEGLVRRAKYLHESKVAYEIFLKNYNAMQHCYNAFFPDLKNFTLNNLNAVLPV